MSGEIIDEMNVWFFEVLDEGGLFDIVIILGGINDFGMCFDENGEFLFSCLRLLYELVFWYFFLLVVVIVLEIGYEIMDGYIVVREKWL